MMYTCTIDTPLGTMRAAAEERCLTGLWFEGQKYYPEKTSVWLTQPHHPVFTALEEWLGLYFAGKNPAPAIPLAPQGTAFQQSVWKILQAIPYGKTTTYGEIAKQLAGETMSAQAVGGAVGHNAISLLIPCHRVIRSDGRLTGYAGGIDKKRRLLALEQGIFKESGIGE